MSLGLPRRFASEVLMFFPWKITNSKTKFENALTLKRPKVETWNLDLRWGTYQSFLEQILGAISYVIRVSEPKNETPIVGLNSCSSKTYCTRRIKLLNLEASGHALSAVKNKPWRFRHFFFFIYFFIYLFKQITLLEQKLGQMIRLYMDLHHYNFGGATSRGLGQMHP